MRSAITIIFVALCLPAGAQTFSLKQLADSVFLLRLAQDGDTATHRLPYPVYRLQQGDLNGDGVPEVMVGVIKATRFYPQPARRLFIFKNYHGQIRPLWLGSRLAGILEDFCYHSGAVVSLEHNAANRWYVCRYVLAKFGLRFDSYILSDVDETLARTTFSSYLSE